MSAAFVELDYRETPIGALSLRRRREHKLGVDVFEIKLGDKFLMSSLFTASEIALAKLGLAELSGERLDASNVLFYSETGLRKLAAHLRPGGAFGLWSNELADNGFTARLARVFASARAEPVTFHNPLQDRPFTQTVYLAKKRA